MVAGAWISIDFVSRYAFPYSSSFVPSTGFPVRCCNYMKAKSGITCCSCHCRYVVNRFARIISLEDGILDLGHPGRGDDGVSVFSVGTRVEIWH